MSRSNASPLVRTIIIVFVIPLALTLAYAHRPGDFAGYLLVGELALQGRDIYREAPANTWPPFFGLLCVPLALLGRISEFVARMFWLLLNWAALVFALDLVARLVHGRRLSIFGRRDDQTADRLPVESKLVLLPLLLCVYWMITSFEWLQIGLILFAMTLYGLLLHRDGRDAPAGFLIGAAAAMKVMPVAFVPYFVWRRQWRAAFFTGLFAAVLTVLPAAIYGWSRFADQFTTWLHVLDTGWGAGKRNLSVYAMLDRILGHGYVPFMHPGTNELPASGSAVVTAAVIITMAIVAVAAMWIFRGRYEPRSRAVVAEWSIVFLVASIFGTVGWRQYLVVLLLPMTLFVATWIDSTVDPVFRRKLKVLTWITFAMGLATASALTGRALSNRLEMGSLHTMMALLFLGTLFWYRARITRASAGGSYG